MAESNVTVYLRLIKGYTLFQPYIPLSGESIPNKNRKGENICIKKF